MWNISKKWVHGLGALGGVDGASVCKVNVTYCVCDGSEDSGLNNMFCINHVAKNPNKKNHRATKGIASKLGDVCDVHTGYADIRRKKIGQVMLDKKYNLHSSLCPRQMI